MAKNKPIITHTEILCLAIESLQNTIRGWDENVEKSKDEATRKMIEEMREQTVARLSPKLEALKSMYKIETGAEYI